MTLCMIQHTFGNSFTFLQTMARPSSKRPRSGITTNNNNALQSSSVCSINESSSRRQLSIRSFCFQKAGNKIKSPTTPPNSASSSSSSSSSSSALIDSGTVLKSISTAVTPTNTSSAPAPAKHNKHKKKRLAQVFLDCGQQNWGQVLCSKCGTLYVPGVQEDTKMHEKMCKPIALGVVWNTQQQQKVVWRGEDTATATASTCTTILIIHPSEQSKYKAKLSQILAIVENDLGMQSSSSSTSSTANTILLYLKNQRVVGFVSVQPVTVGYRLLTLYERDTDPVQCLLGVAVLWTHSSVRQQGIATKLVDMARGHAIFGMQVPKSELAFSSPTEAGWAFAKQYIGNDTTPLVYEYSG